MRKEVKNRKITNADRIRSMTDEELAKMFSYTFTVNKRNEMCLSVYVANEVEMLSTYLDILNWLKEPTESGE